MNILKATNIMNTLKIINYSTLKKSFIVYHELNRHIHCFDQNVL